MIDARRERTIPGEAVTAYLERLGVEAEPPSHDALRRLHRAHVERIPWETLWIHLGQAWAIDPLASLTRFAHQGGSGYCFHLNGAFGLLLEALGYDVTRHSGAVHQPESPMPGDLANHLVLTVRGLSTMDHPDGLWYVDAGLGDALHDPIPLRSGMYGQGPFRYAIEESPGAAGGWRLTHDPLGSFRYMTWSSSPVQMDAFAAQHRHLSTSPDSPFVRVLVAQRRDATGVDTLRARTLRRTGHGGYVAVLDSPAALRDALADVFGIELGGVDSATFATVWDRAERAHEEWLATRPEPTTSTPEA